MSDYGAPITQPVRHATNAIAAAKHDLESTVAEERLRGMVAVAERLEGGLRAALGDLETGRGLIGGLLAGMEQVSFYPPLIRRSTKEDIADLGDRNLEN